jgi:hypothetical protein
VPSARRRINISMALPKLVTTAHNSVPSARRRINISTVLPKLMLNASLRRRELAILALGLCVIFGPCLNPTSTVLERGSPYNHEVDRQEAPIYSTPPCVDHPMECTDLCSSVGKFVKQHRDSVLSNPKSWLWYYEGVRDYYHCIDAKIVVEVGAAFGAQSAYHLKNAPFIQDPFMAGYDPEDPIAKLFMQAAPDATPEDISVAWAQSMAKDLAIDGDYLDTGMPPAGCKLRMHRLKSNENCSGITALMRCSLMDFIHMRAWKKISRPGFQKSELVEV